MGSSVHITSDGDCYRTTQPTLCEVSNQSDMDLCCLAPLWQLYQRLLASAAGADVPSVVRALTELFYAAENLAVVSLSVVYS